MDNNTNWGFVSEVGNISSMGINDPTITNANLVTENSISDDRNNQSEADKLRNKALNDFLQSQDYKKFRKW